MIPPETQNHLDISAAFAKFYVELEKAVKAGWLDANAVKMFVAFWNILDKQHFNYRSKK